MGVTDELLPKRVKTQMTQDRYPAIVNSPAQKMSSSTEPRPIRTKELLKRQQQEELNRRTASASKIGTQNRFNMRQPIKATTEIDLTTATPTLTTVSYTAYYPVRTKELLERQRQEELNRRPASASRMYSTSAKGFNRSAPKLRLPTSKRALLFPPTTEWSASPIARYPSKVINTAPKISPSTEPRPMRTKELLERQKQEDFNRRTVSASKIGLQIHSNPMKAATANELITKTPSPPPIPAASYTAFYPIRTKELLERQRQEELSRRPASASRMHCTTSAKGFSRSTPKLIAPTSKRALLFPPTPEWSTPTKADKFKRLASQLKEVPGLHTITESKLRQLTITDFLSILNHTLPFTGVLAKDLKLDKSNYVNETVIALNKLNYPQKVNQSYLKMPGTRHGLSAILDIVEFLLDFGLVGNMSNIFELPDNERFNEALESYRKWPGNRDELVPLLIYSDAKDQLDSLDRELKHCQGEAELAQILTDKSRIEKKLTSMQNATNTLLKESGANSLKLAQLCNDNWQLEKTIENLQNVVVNQSQCHLAYQRKVNLHDQLLDQLKFLRYQWEELSERFRLLNLNQRRSRKELMEHIEAFNFLVREIKYSSVMDINCSNMELPIPTSLEEIRKRRLLLEHLRNHFECTKRQPLKELKY